MEAIILSTIVAFTVLSKCIDHYQVIRYREELMRLGHRINRLSNQISNDSPPFR
jgi:hypothetical protein